MAEVNDRVEVASRKVGSPAREGVVIAVTGGLLRVAWSTGEETIVTSSVGSLLVVGKARGPAVKSGTRAAKAGRASTTKAGVANRALTVRGPGVSKAAQGTQKGKRQAKKATPKGAKGGKSVPKGAKAVAKGAKSKTKTAKRTR